MADSEINDMRDEADFRGITFSNYKKCDVQKELLKSIIDGKIEHACHWSVELICAGHFMELWDTIMTFIGKYVHLACPRIPLYIEMRFSQFKTLVHSGYSGSEIRLRNNPKFRKLFAEIMCVLCLCKKNHRFESVKIKKSEEYDITAMTQKLKAPKITYAESCFRTKDPKELFIALNEFAYHISGDSRNNLLACYWLEWIMEFETICKAKKEVCRCERRNDVPVEEKLQFDPIWIIWELITEEASHPGHFPLTAKILKSLFALYCIRFTQGVRKKRRYLVYFAISLLNTPYNQKTEIIENKDAVESVVANINSIYKQIKKNEILPATDYLFHGTTKSDLDKTFERLEKLNSINTIIRKDDDESKV
jgi:hypothetical protein